MGIGFGFANRRTGVLALLEPLIGGKMKLRSLR
jgi:hypothetical protein